MAWGQAGRENDKIFAFRKCRSGDGVEVYDVPPFCMRLNAKETPGIEIRNFG